MASPSFSIYSCSRYDKVTESQQLIQTKWCYLYNHSLLSLTSSLCIAGSIVLTWFLAPDGWSFRLRDTIAAVCDAAVADSCQYVPFAFVYYQVHCMEWFEGLHWVRNYLWSRSTSSRNRVIVLSKSWQVCSNIKVFSDLYVLWGPKDKSSTKHLVPRANLVLQSRHINLILGRWLLRHRQAHSQKSTYEIEEMVNAMNSTSRGGGKWASQSYEGPYWTLLVNFVLHDFGSWLVARPALNGLSLA